MIPFNRPHLTGKEMLYIQEAVASGKISGDGTFSQKCHEYFENRFKFKKVLLTTSCTDALEMAAILLDIKPGDEVIAPSFTFVSSVNAFALRGARIVFVDSSHDHPNIDANKIESLITSKTKAIIAVHYAGVACDMSSIMALSRKYGIYVVEDAAQAIDSYFNGQPLGGIGHLGAFSFHETKNIISGEGGMLVINEEHFIERAEIIREKGTNRSLFFRGQVDKYSWVDIGSSFLPSDIIAAFLYAQLENLDRIQNRRKTIWQHYQDNLSELVNFGVKLPSVYDYATNNYHMFYLICNSLDERTKLISHLKQRDILAVFHYQSLHNSQYYQDKHDGRLLPEADNYSNVLIRLPFFYDLSETQVDYISNAILEFYKNQNAV